MHQSTLNFGGRSANTAAKRKSPEGDQPEGNKRVKAEVKPPTKSNETNTSDTKPEAASTMTQRLQIEEEIGDIFSAPPNTLLIHACNCEGSWGAGIALAFKKSYPDGYEVYADHCDQHEAKDLFGAALLIPPPDDADNESKHFVGCLFTSRSKGRKKDSPARILGATGPAMRDLLEQVKEWNAKAEESERVGEVRMCQINSGLFAVPWTKTKAVLEGIEVLGDGGVKVVKVVSRD